MKIVLLAGGLGTRMREETEYKPKPMVEVGGKPVLWHLMKSFDAYGLNEFVVCTGYRGDVIKDYFLNYDARMNDFTAHLGKSSSIEVHGQHAETDWKVTVADTGATTMTGGKLAELDDLASLVKSFGAPKEVLKERRNITLWDKWPLLLAFFGLLTTEWVTRRRSGLV